MSGMKTRRSRKAVRESLELAKLAQRYEIHNRSDGKSPRTVQWYNETVEVFTGWLESEGLSTRVDDVGEDEARLFILHLQERRGLWGKASSHTVNNRVRALRAFFNWLYRQGYTGIDRQYLETPFFGSRRMKARLDRRRIRVSRKRVQRLMRAMGRRAIYRRPGISRRSPKYPVYPYLLRNVRTTRPNQM